MAEKIRGAALPLTPIQRRRLRRELDNHHLLAAGLDPATLTPHSRKKRLAELAKGRARAKSAKQAHVKRLHDARLRSAMPDWVDVAEIQAFYAEARRLTIETGAPHEVDHIEPLLGADSCGLHVPYNLRVITRTENRKKGNRRSNTFATV